MRAPPLGRGPRSGGTTESCDPQAGCRRTPVPNGTSCADANVCNGEETCQSGVCTAGTPPICSGSSIDACDSITGCTQDVMIAAHKLALRMSFSTARLKVALLGTIPVKNPPSNGTVGDPVLHGASFRIVSGDGVEFADSHPLPASNWKYIGPPGSNMGYRYKTPPSRSVPSKVLRSRIKRRAP